jgi:hypothetical protein
MNAGIGEVLNRVCDVFGEEKLGLGILDYVD